MSPRISVVVPVYNEGDEINSFLDALFDSVTMPVEVLAVYDSPDDTTVPHLEKYAAHDPRVVPTHNTYGRGPAHALRYGIDHGIAAASRYAKGGQQIGGPFLKRIMSRMAGLSLYWIARVGTRDATNSFKAYDREFVKRVGIESDAGFELGIELVAKARRRREPVAELPTIWLDRTAGQSNFQVWSWLPRYLRWYRYAFGPRLS